MISVIMPVYNVEDYVAEAIESVRQQSYGEWELLLIDDGSTDESSKICKAYAEKEEKIRYIRKENGGVSSARNRGPTQRITHPEGHKTITPLHRT